MNSKRDFLLGVTNISKSPGLILDFDLVGNIADLRVAFSYVESNAEISIAGVAEAVHGGILVSGEIKTNWNGECRRCLEPACGPIITEVRELYERASSDNHRGEEDDTYHYQGEVIDLREMIKDQVLLELPLAPLCRPGCKGLCPICGSDLNFVQCNCITDQRDPRWSALDVLVDKDR